MDEQGDVPDLPRWSYTFHGIGLCLDGPRRDSIDYDFHDGEGRAIMEVVVIRRAG